MLFLATPFHVGRVEVPNRVVLAPMAGLTCSAYRHHLKCHGVGLVTTEMVSAYGLIYHNARTTEYLDFTEEERPIAVQLFGDRPEVVARAAALVLCGARVPDMIDINMGCPVRKVVKTGAGAALLGDVDRAVEMAAAVVGVATQSGIPVTVKLRSGLHTGDRTAVGLAPRLEQVGVAALGVHPRAAGDFYRGTADHTITAAVVRSVGIPVMASGDVASVGSALTIVETTGTVAVMVARGVAGDPWLVDALLSGRAVARPPLPEVVADLRRLFGRVIEEQGPERATRWIRKVIGWYLRPSGVAASTVEWLRMLPGGKALDEALEALGAG